MKNKSYGEVICLELQKDGKVVSRLTYISIKNSKGIHVLIEDVETLAEGGKGYASELLEKALREAKKQKAYKVTLTCHPKLISFYKKFGFKSRSNPKKSKSVSMKVDLK